MHDISREARVSRLADLEDSIRGSALRIGPGVMIDSFVKIKFTGGLGDITIGAHSHVNSGTVLYSGNGITIGEHVLIASNCTFAPMNHAFGSRDRRIDEQRFMPSRGGIVIEDDVWVGANCVLLDGTILRRGAILGAHSLAIGELAPYSINGGSPARLLRYRPDNTSETHS